jgi:gliding motility-associated-like protein
MKRIGYIFIIISFLSKAGTPSIIFKENKGQWPEKVLFGTEILNTKFYVNKNSFNYCLYSSSDLAKLHEYTHHKNEEWKESRIVHGHNYEVEFVGADLSSVTKTKEQPEYYNYFLGNNKSKWANSIKAYGNLLFNEIYEGVDLKLYSNGANLKYDFVIKPNANVNTLKLNYKYINGIELLNNELIIKTSVGNVVEKEPFAYQIINGVQKQVKCKYVLLSDNSVGFVFPEGYNKNYELLIDPVVVVCSYSNAFMEADGSACTYDLNGYIYVFAYADLSYPTTTGVFQVNYNAHFDYALSVYSTTGSSKLFSTYLGGDSLDFPLTDIVKNNEITLFGQTLSKDFPCTSMSFDTTFNGGTRDLTVSKLNMAGTSLLASTYIGGDGEDGYNVFFSSGYDYWFLGEMVCDTSGNVYIASATTSSNFPVSTTALSTNKQGITDACVFKLDKTLSNLLWSTYLGGTRDENGRSIRLDGSNGVYVYGATTSTNFPVTSGAIQTTKSGAALLTDLYVSHINSTGSSLISSTYLGTIAADNARLMDVDLNGDIYLFTSLSSPSLFTPMPVGIYSNPNGFNAIYKINSSLSSIAFKTKFGDYIPGPSPGIDPHLLLTAFKVDSCQNIYIAGFGAKTFFTTPNAFQPTFGGGLTDLYFMVFSPNCNSLKFASYWGGKNPNYAIYSTPGEHSDGGISHFDDRGYLYQSICINGNLPVTSNAYNQIKLSDTAHWNDAFIKIDFQTFINAGSSYGANITGCPPFTPTFVSTTNTGTAYWDLGNGVTSIKDTISTTYTNLGTYNVLLLVTDTNTCNRTDSIKSILNVINPTEFDLGEDIPTCFNTPVQLNANLSAVSYSWSTGQTTPTIMALPGTYTLTINNGGCNSSDEINVVIGEKKLSERFPNVITPNGDNINDYIDFIKYNFEEVEFYVFDRWGRERYKITKPDEKWNPNDLDNGTYYYVANYRSSCTGKYATDKGTISVFH